MACIRLGIIPAKLTLLLQPADSHASPKYKQCQQRRYLEVSADAVDGEVKLEKFVVGNER